MATIYWRGKSASLNWVEGGKRYRKGLGVHVTEAQAQAALQGIERRLSGLGSAAGPLFGDWAIEYGCWHRDEYPDSYQRVEQILRSYLIPYFGLMPIGDITRQDVERYKHSRLGAAAAGTISKEMRTLQASLNKATDWERIPVNRARGVRPPKDLTSKPPRWYTREELAAIYAADALHAHIWRLMVNTGLRRSEAQHLRRQDVGEDAIRVISTPGARTKSAKWRLVPITSGARIALEALLLSREAWVAGHDIGAEVAYETPHLLTGLPAGVAPGHGSPFVLPHMHGFSLTRAFKRTLGRVGLTGSLHCLRHSYCAHLAMSGVPLRTVQVLAGHSSITVTEKYSHLSPGYLQEAAKSLIL